MATADSVVVELIAKTDGYTAAVNGAGNASQAAFSKVEKTAAAAEAQVQKSSANMGSSFSKAANDIEKGSARAAAATRNLGRQVSDIGVGLTGGQNPFLILSQQAPQVADALADTGGKAAGVARFFAGPWGAALLAAGSALGILLGKALETGESVESLVQKLKDNEQKSRLAAVADQIFAGTQEGLAAKIRETTKALNEQNASLRTSAQLRNVQAQSDVNTAQKQVDAANARVAAARRALDRQQVGGFGTSGAALSSQQALQGSASAKRELQEAQQEAQRASVNLNRSRVFLARESAAADATTAGRIGRQYDDKINALSRAAIVEAGAGKQIGKATQDRINALEREKQAAIETAQASEQAAKSSTRLISTTARTLADLKKLASSSTGTERTRLEKRITTTEKRLSLLKSGVSAGAVAAATAGGGGKSAEQLAREAEAKRVKEVRNNEAFNNEMEQLNGQIINSQRERANTASEAAVFERDAVDSDYRKRKEGIAADLSANKYTQQQADTLDGLNDYSRLLKLRNIAIGEDIKTVQEAAQRDLLTLDIMAQQLQADQQIAETREERKKIELELINLKYQERRIQLEALRQAAAVKGDDGAVRDITEQMDALPGLKRAEQTGVEQRNRGPYEQYRRNLDNADSLSDSIDAVKIDTLNTITDQLTQATTAALGLKGAFGQIAGELIRIGIQRKLIGPLADALFGKSDGSSSGGVGNLLSSIGGLFGRASGGYMAPNSIARVNEGRGGVELLRMGSQGGSIIPLGQTAAPSAARGATIVHAPQFNLKGAVITRELYADMQRISQQSAAQAGQVAYSQAVEAGPSRLNQQQALGT